MSDADERNEPLIDLLGHEGSDLVTWLETLDGRLERRDGDRASTVFFRWENAALIHEIENQAKVHHATVITGCSDAAKASNSPVPLLLMPVNRRIQFWSVNCRHMRPEAVGTPGEGGVVDQRLPPPALEGHGSGWKRLSVAMSAPIRRACQERRAPQDRIQLKAMR